MKWESKDLFFKPVIGIGYLVIGMFELIVTPLGWFHILLSLIYLLSIRMFRNKYHIEKFHSFHISDYGCEKEWNILKLLEMVMLSILLFILIKPIRVLMLILLGIFVCILCIAVFDLFKGQKKSF